jgi:hypothetical protein
VFLACPAWVGCRLGASRGDVVSWSRQRDGGALLWGGAQTVEDDFVSAPKMTVRCVAAKHPDVIGKNGKTSGGTCADGIMNGDETGVDCGGNDCAPCVTKKEQEEAVTALKAKLRKEWEDQQAESRRSGIAKIIIMVFGLVGALFVCGGPVLYLLRAVRVRSSATSLSALPLVLVSGASLDADVC